MERQKVMIVGGGAAGLMAAFELSERCDVTILEATDRIGGRIRTKKIGDNIFIEEGAEFVHGDTPVTNEMLSLAKLKPVVLDGKMLRKEGNKWTEEQEMIEGWNDLVKKMKKQEEDMTMQDFLDKYFKEDKYTDLRRHVRAFVQGFDVAELEKASVCALYREWSNEGDQYRMPTGYGALVDFLHGVCVEAGCTFHINEAVKNIQWQQNKVSVQTSSTNTFEANKIIITVPVSLLKENDSPLRITFSPSIPHYVEAANDIGYGTVVKVIFQLSKKLWPEKTGFLFSDEMIPTWWTQYPLENNLITGWAGGPVAARLSQHSDNELKEIGIVSLSNILGIAPAELRNIMVSYYVFNWSNYPESLGAYSFSTPESANARRLLNTPLNETLFFAGEAIYEGPFAGTVEAALSSGRIVADGVLRSL
jgi:monoamine oxidase